WQQLVTENLTSENPVGFIGEDVGFTVTTEYFPAIREMTSLSERFPNEIFEVTITT
ncbi:MAG: hypothetical protein GY808_09405, partial [Gammaproteobacteria bacterium]|nr:hypothetical protein [Gammaproteobacteria bacterium]